MLLGPKDAVGKSCQSQSPGIICWSPGQLCWSSLKGPSQCFPVAFKFLPFFFSCVFLFIIWLWLPALKYLIYETALKHLFPLCCWKDSRNMGCIFTLESKSSSQACPALSLKLKWQVRGLNEGIYCWDYIAWGPEWQEGSSLYLGSIWVTVTLQHHQKNPRQNNHPM